MKRVVLLALVLAACSKAKDDEKPAEAPAPGTAVAQPGAAAGPREVYRANIVDPELGDVIFYLDLPAPGTDGQAFAVDGERRTRMDADWEGDRVEVRVPLFHASIVATRDPATRALAGEWKVVSPLSGNQTRPFRGQAGTPDPATRVDLGAGPPLDLGAATTIWRATFSDSGEAKVELEQPAPGVLLATITLRTGNVMYLAGNARGDAFRLTGFDGYSTYLLSGSLSADRKNLTAAWAAGPILEWRESVSAQRSDPFDLPITFKAETGNVAGFVPEGEKYVGKPLVVSLSATWCSACFNANKLLRELVAEHAKDDLQAVTLLYEMTDDAKKDQEAAASYKRVHEIPWDVVPVTGPLARAGELIPAELQEVDLSAFPLVIFVGRNGVVRGALSGFPGPESKAEYARVVAAYRAGVAALLADK